MSSLRSRADWTSLGWGATLFAVVVLTYIPALSCGFIWDDDDYVTENTTLRSADGLRRIWFERGATPQYYPLVHTSYWLEYHLWGLDPAGYHLVNVLLHAANTVLVWRVLGKLGIPGAWLAAALFGLHPVHVESVAWVTERKNVLSGLFYLLALSSYLDFAGLTTTSSAEHSRSLFRYVIATLCFVAALLSKSVTCSLPAVICLLIIWRKQRLTWRDIGPLIPWFAIGLTLALNTAALEKSHVGANGSAFPWGFAERCLIATHALCFNVGKLVWPYPLAFIYARWKIHVTDPFQWVYVLIIMATTVSLIIMRRRWGGGPLVAWLYFAGTLLPALGFINVYPMRYSFVADHFQYLASLGPITLIAAVMTTMWRRWAVIPFAPTSTAAASESAGSFVPLATAAAVLLGILAALSWNQQTIYRNPETLWSNVLAKDPQSGIAHFHLGKIRTGQGRHHLAAKHLRDALRLQNDDTEHYIIRSLIASSLVRTGDFDLAQTNFEAALRQNPQFWEALNGLANILSRKGEVGPAIELYRQALDIAPEQSSVHHNLANALAVKGDLEESENEYREALRLNPRYAVAHLNYGNLLARRKRLAEAERHFSAALEIDPELKAASQYLSRVRTQRLRSTK